MLKRLGTWLVLSLVAVIGLLFATKHFLQPMNTDLSVIGQGQPSLVFAHENFSPDSGAVLNQLNRIKRDYQQVMAFAVADLGTPQGQAFARQYNLVTGMAVFLSATGKPLRVMALTNDERALRELLDEELASIGISR